MSTEREVIDEQIEKSRVGENGLRSPQGGFPGGQDDSESFEEPPELFLSLPSAEQKSKEKSSTSSSSSHPASPSSPTIQPVPHRRESARHNRVSALPQALLSGVSTVFNGVAYCGGHFFAPHTALGFQSAVTIASTADRAVAVARSSIPLSEKMLWYVTTTVLPLILISLALGFGISSKDYGNLEKDRDNTELTDGFVVAAMIVLGLLTIGLGGRKKYLREKRITSMERESEERTIELQDTRRDLQNAQRDLQELGEQHRQLERRVFLHRDGLRKLIDEKQENLIANQERIRELETALQSSTSSSTFTAELPRGELDTLRRESGRIEQEIQELRSLFERLDTSSILPHDLNDDSLLPQNGPKGPTSGL